MKTQVWCTGKQNISGVEMVDQGRSLHVGVASAIFNQYPPPLAKYEDVVASRQLFMTTLEKLHAAMASKFM